MRVKDIIKSNRILIAGIALVVILLLWFTMGRTNEADKLFKAADSLYRESVNYRKTGETEKAEKKLEETLDKYQEILEKFPNHSFDIKFALYQIWIENDEEQNDEAAKLALQKLAENFPKHNMAVDNLYLRAIDSKTNGNYEEARRAYQELVDNFPSSTLALLAWEGLGQSNYQLKNYEAARKAFREVLKRVRNNSALSQESRHLIAQSYLDEEEYNQAYIAFDTLTGTEFDGSPQLQEEAMYKAAYSLKSIIIDDEAPSNDDVLSTEALGRYTEFRARFSNSEYVSSAYFDEGEIYANQKKYEFALNRYEDALVNTDNPKRHAEIQLAIGRVYWELDFGDKSIEAAERAIEAAEKTIATAEKTKAEAEENIKKAEKTIEMAKAEEDIAKSIEDFKKASEALIDAKDTKAEKTIEIAKAEEDIKNAKLDRVQARANIADFQIQRKEWQKVRDAYKVFIEEYGEAGYNITDLHNFEEPIKTDFMAACSYWIGEAYYKMNDFGKALEWYEKIVKEKGFQTDDSVPETLKDKDFRTDALAPQALYKALLVRNQLEGIEKLEDIANKYINDIRDDNPLLSAKARFNFGKINHEKLKDYKGAAKEFAKLADYRGSDLRLNLVKLRGKYYEGYCYELAAHKDAEKAYKKAIMLFNLNFQRLIDNPHIKPSNISKKVFDYCIYTAHYYAGNSCFATKQFGKAIAEFEKFLRNLNPKNKFAKDLAKKVRAQIEEAHQKLKDKTKGMDKPDASNNPAAPEQSQTKGQLTPEQIAQKASGSTVFITVEGTREYESGEIVEAALGTGSGFFVKPNQIATNYHVITPKHRPHNKDDDKNEIVFTQPLRGTARIVRTNREYAIIGYTAIDAKRDLAILKVRAFGVKPLSPGNSEKVNRGEPVYVVGNPLGLINVFSEGQISSVQWAEDILKLGSGKRSKISSSRGNSTPYKLLMMTAPISPGNSGGPVVNGKGEVIGVSTLIIHDSENRDQNLNCAVPVNNLKALLNLVGPPKPLSNLEIIY